MLAVYPVCVCVGWQLVSGGVGVFNAPDVNEHLLQIQSERNRE